MTKAKVVKYYTVYFSKVNRNIYMDLSDYFWEKYSGQIADEAWKSYFRESIYNLSKVEMALWEIEEDNEGI